MKSVEQQALQGLHRIRSLWMATRTALVAIANKHARQLWAVLAKGEAYNPEAWRQWGDVAEQMAA